MNRKEFVEKHGVDAWEANQWVGRYTSIGTKRHLAKDNGKVVSIKTRDIHRGLMKKMSAELREHDKTTLTRCTPEQFHRALERFSGEMKQKELNNMRTAGNYGFRSRTTYADVTIKMVKTDINDVLLPRAYSTEAIRYIHEKGLSEKHQLSFELLVVTGTRAHELLTIRPAHEQPPSDRNYTERYPDRPSDWLPYTVKGKGGLVILNPIPPELAARLEAVRIPERNVVDRNIPYDQVYNLVGGKALSQAFTRAAQKTLGFSNGIHGCRHTYAQRRMDDLARFGYDRDQSLLTVSQEMGHLRPEITEVYLR